MTEPFHQKGGDNKWVSVTKPLKLSVRVPRKLPVAKIRIFEIPSLDFEEPMPTGPSKAIENRYDIIQRPSGMPDFLVRSIEFHNIDLEDPGY